tara:strand:- start:220 stop:729 length:510 start_codon:yes stop_codon:yes gene_type:complete
MPSTVGKSYIKEQFNATSPPQPTREQIMDNIVSQGRSPISENFEMDGRVFVDQSPQQSAPISTILQLPQPLPPQRQIPVQIEPEVIRLPPPPPPQQFSWSSLPEPSSENIVDYVAISYKIANILRGNDPIAYKQCSNFYRNDNTIYIIIIIFLLICCMYFYKTNKSNEM